MTHFYREGIGGPHEGIRAFLFVYFARTFANSVVKRPASTYLCIVDIEDFNKRAQSAEEKNKKLFAKLKRTKPKDLDKHVHQFHDEAFEKIDCLTCANCCKTTSPIFYQNDLDRAAKFLKMKTGDFIQKYIHMDEDGDFVLNEAPCAFLGSDNYCSIYEARPTACREYPHTNRKKMVQIMDLTMKNTMVCPAVLEISEKLRKIY